MKVSKFILGQLNTNCYLLIDSLSDQCLLIDPADEPELISEEILRQNLKPVMMVATHGHYDHILAVSALQLNFDLPFAIHTADNFLVKNINKSASYWQKQKVELAPPTITNFLQDGETINCGSFELEVLHTPGHTPGAVCFVNHQQQFVLTGDTLFAQGRGRTDFSYSLPQKMQQSVQKIKQDLEGYRAYPGHGSDFII